VCTSLLAGDGPEMEATPLQISTMADTWIHLSYLVRGGERNRALSIVKSRGTGHSNQVRELILSDDGVDLAGVYTVGGEVLMGTLRWEREEAARREKERRRLEYEQRARQLTQTRADARARAQALEREIEAIEAESRRLEKDHDELEETLAGVHREVGRMRGEDEAGSGAGDQGTGEQPQDQRGANPA
jgi:circadian clock protein KaiC